MRWSEVPANCPLKFSLYLPPNKLGPRNLDGRKYEKYCNTNFQQKICNKKSPKPPEVIAWITKQQQDC
jgi:hypothetical protein